MTFVSMHASIDSGTNYIRIHTFACVVNSVSCAVAALLKGVKGIILHNSHDRRKEEEVKWIKEEKHICSIYNSCFDRGLLI